MIPRCLFGEDLIVPPFDGFYAATAISRAEAGPASSRLRGVQGDRMVEGRIRVHEPNIEIPRFLQRATNKRTKEGKSCVKRSWVRQVR
jgi:hypothetical protein